MIQKINKESKVTLREVTKESVLDICRLSLAEHQKEFVASNSVSIAEAHFQPDYAWFRAIYADEIPVGFVLIGNNPNDDYAFLWRFMIDKNYQQMGFGKKGLDLTLEHLKSKKNVRRIITSYHKGPGDPSNFYKKSGFSEINETDDLGELGKEMKMYNETPMELKFYPN
jgi:diamine N-acetyltransferase